MQLETFRGRELPAVIRHVRRALGDDAMIVRTHVLRRTGGNVVEVVAADPEKLEAFRRSLDGGLAAARRARSRRRIGPYVIALVGPPGAGKTTSAVKLALHPEGVGNRSVGLLTLDTYRVGGVEELQTYAEIADMPLEVIYHAREVPAAIERLRDREVVIVDTPGRWTDDGNWTASLAAIDADEIHLVVPAGLRHEVAVDLARRFESANVTHILISKLDETPGDLGLAQMAEALELPSRWVSDGFEIPGALATAAPRILGSLGLLPSDVGSAQRVG
jgi:flagellar biosynthesis protein FlhF